MPTLQSDMLRALLEAHAEELSEEETTALSNAIQTAQRLQAGEGFSCASVVGQGSRQPRVDVAWMGMMAQVSPDQAREIGTGLFEAAAESEADAALLAFCFEMGFNDVAAGAAVGMMRRLRRSLRKPVVALIQEPSASGGTNPQRKPS